MIMRYNMQKRNLLYLRRIDAARGGYWEVVEK